MSQLEAPLGSGAMFDRIAHRYDALNRVLSLGLDQGWRRAAVRALGPLPGQRILDLATGTGDLALAVARAQPGAEVVGLDPSPEMLHRAALKAEERALTLSWTQGDAQALPFPDASFDGATMAFGIRNVPDRARALAEIARVLRPGGRVVILELASPEEGLLAPLAAFYIRQVVPRVGAWFSGAREYRHLERSIAAFPRRAEFAAMMERAGLAVAERRPLSLGVAVLFVGERRGR